MKRFRVYIVKRKKAVIITAAVLCTALLAVVAALFSGESAPAVAEGQSSYVILSMNESGMHCMQEDYSSYLILPPSNNLKVQVFKKGKDAAELVNSGIRVEYEMVDNTTSADKNNFWKYAADYGFDVPPNIGITGNGLKGACKLSADKKFYEATSIPVIPYNDGSKKINPYQTAKITVRDEKTGDVLVETANTVIPVSTEMNCALCHGEKNTGPNILAAHDRLSKTKLAADLKKGVRRKCSDCHADSAISAPGKRGVPPLSQAIHGFHADKMAKANVKPVCYTCHPGVKTLCNRGVMYAAGLRCDNEKCHGSMKNVAKTQENGRRAWIDLPDCAACHNAEFGSNPNTLYRDSYLQNAPAPEMDGIILCASCHNPPHAEWKSTLKIDNRIPLALLGYENFIDKCTVCHEGTGAFHR